MTKGNLLALLGVPLAILLGVAMCSPSHGYERGVCTTSLFYQSCGTAEQPSAKTITGLGGPDGIRHEGVTDEDRLEWAKRCKPRKVFDGQTDRWVYAERFCDVGAH